MDKNSRRDLKMVGTTTSAGGTFGNVKLIGESVLAGDVDCLKLSNVGELVVNGSLRAERLKMTGECEVHGSFTALTVRGRGEIKIRQTMRGESVKYTGNIETGGDCEANSLELGGAFDVSGLLSADRLDVKMYGHCRAKEIGGTKLRVKRSKASRLLNLVQSKERAMLNADQIEGDTVELDYTIAGVVRGNNVTIGAGCEIGIVEYRDKLNVHNNAVVKKFIRL